jgi:PBP1b-binding outer membrane lipoprotein LpoB
MRSRHRLLSATLLALTIAGCSGEDSNNSPPVTDLPKVPTSGTSTRTTVNKPPPTTKGRGIALPGAGGGGARANPAPGS